MKTHSIGGVEMKFPIMLGAGVAKRPNHLLPYLHPDLPLGADMIGSCTLEERMGNTGTLSWPEDWTGFLGENFGLNSFGMPNDGIEKTLAAIENLSFARPCVVSVAGFSVEEFLQLIERTNCSPAVSAIEVNLGCPNTGKVPFAYDLQATRDLLEGLKSLVLRGVTLKPIWLKVSPYLTSIELEALAVAWPNIDFSATPTAEERFVEEIVRLTVCYPFVKAMVFGNTLGNCRYFGIDGKPVTTPFEGKAGLSGPILKTINLRLLKRARAVIKQQPLDLIACGGVLCGDDAYDYLYAEAVAVQCTSGPVWHPDGPRFLVDLVVESEPLQVFIAAYFPT